MDPVTALGAAGSVVGIAGFGIQLSQVLAKYISQVWNAQESLQEIVDEIQFTTSALEGVYHFLKQEVVNIKQGGPLSLFSEISLIKVKDTADRCLVVFWRIEATISGNWPAEVEDQLVKKLTEFNEKLASHSPETPITIELELAETPLGLRDKFRWASKASKLDKYCTQLQRYQDNLQLLLQVVSLGQQRIKPTSTEDDIKLMLKSYAIINQVATPEELRIIAQDARAQSQTQHWDDRRDPSIFQGQAKRSQSYTRHRGEGRNPSIIYRQPERPNTAARSIADDLRFGTVPIKPAPTVVSKTRPKSPSAPRSVAGNSPATRDPRPVTPIPMDKNVANGHNHAPVCNMSDVPSSITKADEENYAPVTNQSDRQPSMPHAQKPLAHSEDPESGTINSKIEIWAKAKGLIPNGQTSKQQTQTLPDKPPPEPVPNIATPGRMVPRLPSASQSATAPPKFANSFIRSSTEQQDDHAPTRIDAADSQLRRGTSQGQENGQEIQILPYVIYDGGAYQLPVSLELELKNKLEGGMYSRNHEKELAEKLAFLSPGQIRTLQDILRYNSGEQTRKLTRLEVLKKSSLRFWQKTRVMIAFVEGDASSMPEGISSVNEDSADSRAGQTPLRWLQNTGTDMSQQRGFPQNTLLNQMTRGTPDFKSEHGLSGAELSPKSQPQIANSSLPQMSGRNVISHVSSVAPASRSHHLGEPNVPNAHGLPSFQDVTIVSEEEWRRGLAEYMVWTIRPYPNSGVTQLPPDNWDRCLLSEEFLSIPEIKRRLNNLDRNPMTILQKMNTLDGNQRIQVEQSVRAVKTGETPVNNQWNLRQLEIIRSKRIFRPKGVKTIVVYVSRVPPPQYEDSEDSDRGQSDIEKSRDGGRQLDRSETMRGSGRGSIRYNGTGSDDDSVGRQSSLETLLRRNTYRETIERANSAIANRSAMPSQRLAPTRPSSTYSRIVTRSRSTSPEPVYVYKRSGPASRRNSVSERNPVWTTINNRVISRDDDAESGKESDLSERADHRVRWYADQSWDVKKWDEGNPRHVHIDHRPQATKRGREDFISTPFPEELRLQGNELRGRDRDRDRDRDERAPRLLLEIEDKLRPHAPRRSSFDSDGGITSYSKRPNSTTAHKGPRLLTYLDEEEEPRGQERYPTEFDRQPYNPQLSSQMADAYKEPIEQLLLEWTPHHGKQSDVDDDDMGFSLFDGENVGDLTEDVSSPAIASQAPLPRYLDQEPDSTEQVAEEKQGRRQDDTEQVDVVLSSSETRPITVEGGNSTRIKRRSASAVAKTSISKAQKGSPSRTEQPPPDQVRRETTDGNELQEAVPAQSTSFNSRRSIPFADNDNVPSPRIPPIGDGIARPATFSIPTRQAWTGTDWARQIVEQTAIVAEPEEYESFVVRRPGTARTEILPRGRDREYETEVRRERERRPQDNTGRSSRSEILPPRHRDIEYESEIRRDRRPRDTARTSRSEILPPRNRDGEYDSELRREARPRDAARTSRSEILPPRNRDDSEYERERRARDTATRYRRSPSRHRSRNASRERLYDGSFERLRNPPARRRTVEFVEPGGWREPVVSERGRPGELGGREREQEREREREKYITRETRARKK
ncbi:hypothetical protein F4777DRAFT_456728 [Nemania sp. FL0916]|nr:hypothetical protein F4777DRAFT_456728 [Nemania sp. FL0916]